LPRGRPCESRDPYAVPPRSAAAYGSRLPTSAFTRVFDTLWAGTTRKCEWHSANSGDCLNEPLGEWTAAEAALLVNARKLTPVVRERAGGAERRAVCRTRRTPHFESARSPLDQSDSAALRSWPLKA
jgi:hypothetical protein